MLRPVQPDGAGRGTALPFTDHEIAVIEPFAAEATRAIENARLYQELVDRTAHLAHSADERQALGEVGQVASSSLDLPTVLTTIVS